MWLEGDIIPMAVEIDGFEKLKADYFLGSLIAELPVPSEQMMMFLRITLGGLVVSQFPWTSNPGAKQQIPEVTFDPALKAPA